MKYIRRTTSTAAGNGLGTTINKHSPAMQNKRRRGQRPGQHDQVPATHNELRRGHWPGEAIKYLRCTTSGAAGNGLGTTIKYLRVAAGIGLGTALNYLRGAAGNGRAQRSSTFDAQRTPPRETVWAPRQMNTTLRCTTSAATGNGLDNTIKYLQRTTSGKRRRGHRPS